jgi:hypothetical protein
VGWSFSPGYIIDYKSLILTLASRSSEHLRRGALWGVFAFFAYVDENGVVARKSPRPKMALTGKKYSPFVRVSQGSRVLLGDLCRGAAMKETAMNPATRNGEKHGSEKRQTAPNSPGEAQPREAVVQVGFREIGEIEEGLKSRVTGYDCDKKGEQRSAPSHKARRQNDGYESRRARPGNTPRETPQEEDG